MREWLEYAAAWAGLKISRTVAEAGGAICGSDFAAAAYADPRAAAPHGDVQFAARVSGLDRREAQAGDPRHDPPDRLDGGRIFAISEIHARAHRAHRGRRWLRKFRRGAAPRQRRAVSHRPHERVGTGALRACAVRISAAFSGSPDREPPRRRADQRLSLPLGESADREEPLRAGDPESAGRRRHGR